MKTIFWNANQNRLRAVWRILFQGFLLLILTFFLGGMIPLMISLVGNVIQSLGASSSSLAPGLWTTDAILGSSLWLGVGQFIFTAAIFLSVWLAGRRLDHRQIADFGFHFSQRWWLNLGFGLVLGAFLMLSIFFVEYAAGWVTIQGAFPSPARSFSGALVGWFLFFILVGFGEELFSRGYQLRNMAEGFNLPALGPRAGLLLGYMGSSIFFSLLHLGNPNTTWISTLNLILSGLFLGLGMVLTGELAIPIGIHITWNFFQGNVFGFPVSGLAIPAHYIDIQQDGPVLWTGGRFGPEAGLLGVLAMFLGMLLIYGWVRWQQGRVGLRTDLAEYLVAEKKV